MGWGYDPSLEPGEARGGTALDFGKQVVADTLGTAAIPFSAGQAAAPEDAPNADKMMRGLSRLFHNGQEAVESTITAGGKRARESKFFAEPGEASVMEAPISSMFMKSAGVLPQVAVMMLFPPSILGELVAGGTLQAGQMIDTVVARTNKMSDVELGKESPIFRSMIDDGVPPEIARKRLIRAQIDAKDLLAAGIVGAAGIGGVGRVAKGGAGKLAGEAAFP